MMNRKKLLVPALAMALLLPLAPQVLAADITVDGELTESDPLFDRGNEVDGVCGLIGSGAVYAYDTYTVQHAGGPFKASMKRGPSEEPSEEPSLQASKRPLSDPYLMLYRNSFNAQAPCDDIARDDDGGGGLDALIERADLDPGRYIIVATSISPARTDGPDGEGEPTSLQQRTPSASKDLVVYPYGLGTYTLTHNATAAGPLAAPAAVPVDGIGALGMLGAGLALFGWRRGRQRQQASK